LIPALENVPQTCGKKSRRVIVWRTFLFDGFIHWKNVLKGRYQLATKLGYGSSSTIWLARDLNQFVLHVPRRVIVWRTFLFDGFIHWKFRSDRC
jgi:hypothetical protein